MAELMRLYQGGDFGLDHTARWVLVVLAGFADDDARCSPTHTAIGKVAALHTRTVGEAIGRLIEGGWVSVSTPAGVKSTYRIERGRIRASAGTGGK